MNCKIHPILYDFFLRIHDTLGAEIVHRRKRNSATSIEIIFYCDDFLIMTGRLNTLPEAEKWGFWVICRLQPNKFYNGHQVYQLFLSPVHPKKRREMQTTITSLIQPASAALVA
jgi:hypothetical protein